MTTVLFVHGTGVRQPAYQATFDRVRARLATLRPNMAIAPCYWGGAHGSRLNSGGVSVPGSDSARGLNGSSNEDAEVALWAVLEQDPLFELRLLNPGADDEAPPNAPRIQQRLFDAARRLTADELFAAMLDRAGLGSVFEEAVERVLACDAAQTAESRAALARAFLAESLVLADDRLNGPVPLDGDNRDELVALIVAGLGGSDRGLGTFALDLALRLGTWPIQRRRAQITNAAGPVAGDVLLYLARGEPIRDFIATAVKALDGPVVIIAHSLGGIASLELLGSVSVPQVELLITVGSQAPLLYELNALPTLEFGASLPDSVPRWVNVFDRRDLLAYAGSRIFPDRVEDRHVNNGAPFPRAHSAYFANDRFYQVLGEVLP